MPARGGRRWKWQGVMQLRMPKGQVVSPRRRGYAQNCATRQAFFLIFFQLFLGQTLTCEKTGNSWHRCLVAVASGRLIVGKIIWPILSRRSEHLIALDGNAAAPARTDLVLIGIRRNDSGTARR